MKKNNDIRNNMLSFINKHNSKYDNIFLKIINYYGVRDVGKLTNEQLFECCKELRILDLQEQNEKALEKKAQTLNNKHFNKKDIITDNKDVEKEM